MLQLFFSPSPPSATPLRTDGERITAFHLAALNHGVFLAPRGLLALSTVLDDGHLDDAGARLSAAALETLAIVSYKQPLSRAQVAAIRGVNVDGVVRTLLARGMVTESGQDPTGGAVLYGTTDLFLQRMGLDSLDDLPALAPYLPSAEVLEELAAEGLA